MRVAHSGIQRPRAKAAKRPGGGYTPPPRGWIPPPRSHIAAAAAALIWPWVGGEEGGDVVGDMAWRDAGQGAGRGAAPGAAKGKFQPEGRVSLPQKQGQLSSCSAGLESVTSRDKECVPKELETSQGSEEPLDAPSLTPSFLF